MKTEAVEDTRGGLPRVNWFSPLPPARTGIAEFTAVLAPHLRAHADVRFVAPAPADGVSFRPFLPIAAATQEVVNRADANFFNIGNNARFHEEIWAASTRSGGIAILHDARLQHLVAGVYLDTHKNPDGYLALMRETYGIEGMDGVSLLHAGRITVEALAEAFPLLEPVVRGAAGVVVHSGEAERLVRARCSVPVVRLPLPYEPGLEPPPRAPDVSGTAPLHLLAFGHIGPNRRLECVLRAMAGIRNERPCRLDVVGDVWDADLLTRLAQSLGIADRLHLHGFLDDGALDAAIAAADLVVNLRVPTMGEASYSQLRAMRHGVATLVSSGGWYGELLPDAAIAVPPGREVEEIAAFLRAGDLATRLRSVGRCGRARLVAQHAPARYVEGLLDFARCAGSGARPLAAALAGTIARDVLALGRPGSLLTEAAAHAGDFLAGDAASALSAG